MVDDEWARKTINQIKDKANLIATTPKAGFPKRSRSRQSNFNQGGPKRPAVRAKSRSLDRKGPPPAAFKPNRSRSRETRRPLCINFQKVGAKTHAALRKGGRIVYAPTPTSAVTAGVMVAWARSNAPKSAVRDSAGMPKWRAHCSRYHPTLRPTLRPLQVFWRRLHVSLLPLPLGRLFLVPPVRL